MKNFLLIHNLIKYPIICGRKVVNIMEKVIELLQLADIGKGSAKISPCSVEIEISGINGSLKAWLIGGEAVPIGNIVDGKLRKEINTTRHNGILITQGGRQMLIGKYTENSMEIEKRNVPFDIPGFNWRKIESKNYDNLCRELRFIISNKEVYHNYKKYGHYWVGEGENATAVALRYSEDELNPLEFLGKMKFTKNGYAIVCVDKKTKKLYIP